MIIAQRLQTVVAGWLLVLVLAAPALTGCSDSRSPQTRVHSFSGATMGTSYTVKVVAATDADLSSLQQSVQSVLNRIESRMSTYQPDSELSRFNRAQPNSWFEVSEETQKVVALGQEISKFTSGAFDMTVGPLVNLWGFGPDGRISKSPSQQQIDALLERIGYQAVQTRQTPAALRKRHAAYLDLSAIAKGYAVDAVAARVQQDYPSYLIEVGGELKARGQKPGAEPWRVAVESPQVGLRQVQKVLIAADIAIATSGDYRNYFEQDGIRFSHTIDPRDGRPINHRLASVTILDPSCARADALATAMMVLGPEQGMALAKAQRIPAFFISKSEQGFVESYTPEFESFLMQ